MATVTDPAKTVNRHPLVRSLNCHITCGVCKGYLIDATTVTECLHSFCRSCVVDHVTNKSHTCPSCGIQLKETRLFSLLKSDRILQSIVYKSVPNLAFEELKRRTSFHQTNSPNDNATSTTHEQSLQSFFGAADPISLSLEYANPVAKSSNDSDKTKQETSDKRYFRCPAALPIGHLMKFLINKYEVDSLQYQAEILFDGCPLSPTDKLLDVAYMFSWDEKEPLRLWFRFVRLAPVDSAAIQKSCTEESSSSRETTDTALIKEASNLNKPSQSLKKPAEKLDPAAASDPLSPCGESHHQTSSDTIAKPVVDAGESCQLANNSSSDSREKEQEEQQEEQSATGNQKHDLELDGEISLSVESARVEEECSAVNEPGNEETERRKELDSTTAAGNLPAIVIDSREKSKINAPPDVTSQISVDSTAVAAAAAATGVSDSEKPITKSWVPRAVFDLDDPTLLGKRLQKQSEANATRTDPYLHPSSSPANPPSAKKKSDISVFDFDEPTLPDKRIQKHSETSTTQSGSYLRPFSSLRSSRDVNEPSESTCSPSNSPTVSAKQPQNHTQVSSTRTSPVLRPNSSPSRLKDVKKPSEGAFVVSNAPTVSPNTQTDTFTRITSPPSSSKDVTKPSDRAVSVPEDLVPPSKRLQRQSEGNTVTHSDSYSRPGSSSSGTKDGEKPTGSRKTKRQELTSIIDSIFESKRLKQDTAVKGQDERPSAAPSHTGATGSAFSIERLSVPDSYAATLTQNAQGGGGGKGGSARSKALIIDGSTRSEAAPVHDSIGALDLSSRSSEPILSPAKQQQTPAAKPSSSSPTTAQCQGPHPFFLASAGPALYDPLSLLKAPLAAPLSLDTGKKAVHEWLSLISHQLEVSRKLSPMAMHAAARPVPPLKRLSCSPAETGLVTAPSFRSTKANQAALLKLPQGPLCTATTNGSRTKQLSAHVRHIPNPSLMQLQRRLASNLPCYLPSKD